jgi:hypothetical protein
MGISDQAGRKLRSRGGIQPRKHMYNLIELFINGRLIEDSAVLPVLLLILVQDMAERSGWDCKSSERMEREPRTL